MKKTFLSYALVYNIFLTFCLKHQTTLLQREYPLICDNIENRNETSAFKEAHPVETMRFK